MIEHYTKVWRITYRFIIYAYMWDIDAIRNIFWEFTIGRFNFFTIDIYNDRRYDTHIFSFHLPYVSLGNQIYRETITKGEGRYALKYDVPVWTFSFRNKIILPRRLNRASKS